MPEINVSRVAWTYSLACLGVRVRGYVGVRSWQVGAVERAAKSRVLRLEALPRSLPYGI